MDETAHPAFATTAQLLTSQAQAAPNAVAIRALDRPPLTYARLLEQVETTVTALNRLGLGRGDTVALVLGDGPEMATAFLATAACSVCAPLNPAYTETDFEFYLTDLSAKAVIVSAGTPSPVRVVADRLGLRVLELHPSISAAAGCFTLTGEQQAGPARQSGYAEPEDIALVLHTSGTTSRPKQVPLTQTNICISAHNVATTLAFTPQDSGLSVMPLFHIHGLIHLILAPLAAGSSIACTTGFNSQMFYRWLTAFRPSWYSASPTIHQAILGEAPAHRAEIAQHPLRFIRSASSPLPPQLFHRLAETFNCPVCEAYGMTEAAQQIASNPIEPGAAKPGSVGLSAGPEVAILDVTGAPLETGQSGEVAIRGPNVFAGYANNPEANARAFINGWFLTGDQGYLDADGYLFITGRLKEIINCGGEKIVPREVDEALLDHPAVHQAVAFAVPHPTLGDDLAVAIVPKTGQKLSEAQVREFALARLAGFKVPSQVVVVDSIPKGPTGKLQRIGLADVFAAALKSPYVAPRDALETRLIQLIQEVLGCEKISVRDNFFALGGDSLSATQMITRTQDATGVALSITSLFEQPTVEGLARLIRKALPFADDPELQAVLLEMKSLSDAEAMTVLANELGPTAQAPREPNMDDESQG